MYTTIRVYSGSSELGAELQRKQDSVKRAISAVPGFQAYYWVATADGGGASVTVCDDQAGAEASNAAAAAWIPENLPGLSVAPPTISAGEVLIAF
jgi:uncharacterized protein YmfQ (DUF2313 family)